MTVASPDMRLRSLARPGVPLFTAPSGHDTHNDRVFVTMLSLNFMLLAFFVVLGTGASFDRTRVNVVTTNVRVAFAGSGEDEKTHTAHLSARQTLQAGVSQAFAELMPSINLFTIDNSDRIDVSLPATLFGDANTPGLRESVYDALAQVLQAAPPGFRYVLLLSAAEPNAPAFRAAHELSERGVAAENLLVGSAKGDGDRVEMSFLVLEGDTDDEPWSAPALMQIPRPQP